MTEVTRRVSLADHSVDEATRKAIGKEIAERGEYAPSARHQSESYRFFQEALSELGTPYDVTRIPISVLRQMERDPMIAFGLHFIRTPIIRARWYIECERADIAAFVDKSLRRILPRLIFQYSGAWNYGFKPVVKRFQFENPNWTYLDPTRSDDPIKVWDKGGIEAITWKTFVPLPSDPSVVEPKFTARGEFDGINYNGGALPLPFRFPLNPNEKGDESSKSIPVSHSLWFTNEKDSANGSLYGYPRTGYAFRFWWSSWFRWALYDRFFERKADPPYVVYYPTGDTASDYTEVDEGERTSMKAIALSLAEAARSGGGIAMPGRTISGYDDRPTSIREWEISELEVKGDMSHFVESFEYLDVMKLRSLFIPEQAFLEGKGGTSSRNVASEELGVHKEGVSNEADSIDEHINRYIIPDLVAANFPDYVGDCRKITTGFTEADEQTLDSVLQLIGQSDVNSLTQNVDVREVLERMGLPLVSQEIIRAREEKIRQEIESDVPPAVVPEAGGSAGVNQEGLYVQAPSIITLADDSSFITSLPKSRHYKDKTVLASTRQLRSRWKQTYADVYEDFAKYVSKIKLDELTLDEADDQAERIVNKWKYDRKKLSALLSDSQNIIKRVLKRAAQIELKRARLQSDWEPDAEDIAEFLEDRGANYVRAIDETTRNELKAFLAAGIRAGITNEELSSAVREHFADFPDWKADRLVRSEIRDSYNFAQLSAGEKAGIKIVQAKDAQHGETDHECEEREGKFFKIGDALSETLKEHPNGTLEWVLTKRENLSIDIVSNELNDDKLAHFDNESGIVYLSDNLPKKEQVSYLIHLGETLENE